jgi:hypothetical protein
MDENFHMICRLPKGPATVYRTLTGVNVFQYTYRNATNGWNLHPGSGGNRKISNIAGYSTSEICE